MLATLSKANVRPTLARALGAAAETFPAYITHAPATEVCLHLCTALFVAS